MHLLTFSSYAALTPIYYFSRVPQDYVNLTPLQNLIMFVCITCNQLVIKQLAAALKYTWPADDQP